jgi:FtsP/CotA-like multicopper oxidase with cupredoxin domain
MGPPRDNAGATPLTSQRIMTFHFRAQVGPSLYVNLSYEEYLSNFGPKYNLEATSMSLSPDGFSRPMMVFNGQYPGPTIVADWGDTIEVTVKNSLETNGE